jgi:membrane associated rhomboid family serine protease
VIWFPFLFLPIFFELPAISFLGFWIIMQAYKAMTVLVFEGAVADVAWWAHLGGFVAGGFLYPLFLKNRDSNEDL